MAVHRKQVELVHTIVVHRKASIGYLAGHSNSERHKVATKHNQPTTLLWNGLCMDNPIVMSTFTTFLFVEIDIATLITQRYSFVQLVKTSFHIDTLSYISMAIS